MNESEWMQAEAPNLMLEHLDQTISPRKLRLFGVACCRRIWDLITEDKCRRAVVLAERLADGRGSWDEATHLKDDLKNLYLLLNEQMCSEDKKAQVKLWCIGATQNTLQHDEAYLNSLPIAPGEPDLIRVFQCASSAIAYQHVEHVSDPLPAVYFFETRAQANLLREVLGNPFENFRLDRNCLNEKMLKFAEEIYEDSAFQRIPDLGKMLKDAGCKNEGLLEHCHRSIGHVRGCWAIDRILGKY